MRRAEVTEQFISVPPKLLQSSQHADISRVCWPQIIQSEGCSPLITRFRPPMQAAQVVSMKKRLALPTKGLKYVSIEPNVLVQPR
jgi:hypothetical protein